MIDEQRAALDLSKPQIFVPLRMALTGQKNSPSIVEVMTVLGKDEVGQRIQAAGKALENQ